MVDFQLFMLELNPEKFYNELLTNKNIYNVVNYNKELLQKPLLILDENERNKIWIEKLKNVEYVLMQTDHSISDKRSELITKVINWLNN